MSPHDRRHAPETLDPLGATPVVKKRTASGTDWPLAPEIAQQILEAARPETAGTKAMKNTLAIIALVISILTLAGVVWNAASVQTQMRSDIDATAKALAAHLTEVAKRREDLDQRIRDLEVARRGSDDDVKAINGRLDKIEKSLERIENALSDGRSNRRQPRTRPIGAPPRVAPSP